MNIKRIMVSLASLLLPLWLCTAQNIEVKAPNLVALDEQFQLVFSVEGEEAPSDFQWPGSPDFKLVWGPQKSSSTSISIINGKHSKSTRNDYIYILIPTRTGNLQIPSATASFKNRKVTSKPTAIEVASQQNTQGRGSAPSSSQNPDDARDGARQEAGVIDSGDLFMKLTFSKTSAYVGETITAALKLYSKVNIAGFDDARLPVFNGFWSQQNAPSSVEFQRESYNGQIYNSAVLRSYILIPQQSGDIIVDPAELICLVNERVTSRAPRSIFDSFFEDEYRTIRKRVSTPERVIHVKDLPSGAPASFGGGVGSFKMTASLTRDSLKTHDASALRITVSGTGNLSMLESPKIDFPPDFEVYDTKVTDNSSKDGSRVSGSKTFEFPFIPRSHGDFVIPAVEYSYFDIEAGKYVRLSTEDITISVKRGNESEAPAQAVSSAASVSRRDVKDLGTDIRYIRTKESEFSRKGEMLVFSTLFWLLLVLIVIAGVVVWFVVRVNLARRADVAGSKNRAATKMARRRLANAGDFLKRDLYTAFYEELHKALLGYASDKLTMDPSEMSKDNIASRLSDAGALPSDIEEFASLLDSCEMARYSPDNSHDSMNEHYDKALNVISSIDSSIRSGKPRQTAGTIVSILCLLLSLPLAATPWEDGVQSYASGDYQTALEHWSSIEAEGLESADLYYNMGNAWFKQNDYARAILYYERAARLDPSDKDVRNNLEFARTFTQDRIEAIPEILIEQAGRKVCRLLASDVWAVLFLVFFALTVCCILIFLLSERKVRRKTAFYLGIFLLLVSLLSLDFAQWQWSDYNRRDAAIVMVPVSSVKNSPSPSSSKSLFVLHEGTKVKLLDTLGEWCNIELSDGRQGWIPADEIDII